jgi:long-subunit acyl-CoA synthetase (AMP-forming)
MKGYWRNESATKDIINDWSRFNSGDLKNLINQHLEKYLLIINIYFQKDKKRVKIYIYFNFNFFI